MIKFARPKDGAKSQPLTEIIGILKKEARTFLGTLPEKLSDIPGNHKRIGKAFLEQEQTKDAIMRFKLARWMRPQDAEIVALLAKAYATDGDIDAARATLKELKQKHPSYPELAADSAAVEKMIHDILHPPKPEPKPENKAEETVIETENTPAENTEKDSV